MNLKENCLEILKKGSWTFDVLGPLFRSALIKRVQGQNPSLSLQDRSMMELTLLAYRRTHSSAEPIRFTDLIIDPTLQSAAGKATLLDLAESTVDGGSTATFTTHEQARIHTAIKEVAKYAPDTAQEFRRWITHFLKLDGVPFRSASHPHAFGCIFLSSRITAMNASELATSLVHEMGHQDLFLLNIIDRLIQEQADYKMAHAPFQGVLRPPIGRLHSYFALYRMIQFERLAGSDTQKHCRLFCETRESFAREELTDYGFQIVEAAATFIGSHSSLREQRVL